jgi:2-polyprenyl-6-methoxyphenol hydroxylase-like FAD-dependent oxidoreductase
VGGVRSALVVGAGIGGLAAATRLAQLGVEVEVAEIKAEINVYGVGINQPGNALRALDTLGVLEQVLAVGFAFDHWKFYDYRGAPIVDVRSRLADDRVPANCALPRRELHRILSEASSRAGVAIRYGTSISELEETGSGVGVEFADGSSAEYDVVVGFDGINSELRKRLFGDVARPAYTGFAAWRVTVPRPPELDYGALYQSPVHKAGHIPLTEREMYLLLVSAEPEGIHYASEDLAGLLGDRLPEFEGVIGEIRDQLGVDDEIVYSPLSEVLLPPPWHRGRVVIAGDAAHACTPHLAQGAAMALEDAIVLARLLTETATVDGALDEFSQRRFPRVRFVQEASRAVLDAEMSVNEENLSQALEAMVDSVPQQFGTVDDLLNQPA